MDDAVDRKAELQLACGGGSEKPCVDDAAAVGRSFNSAGEAALKCRPTRISSLWPWGSRATQLQCRPSVTTLHASPVQRIVTAMPGTSAARLLPA